MTSTNTSQQFNKIFDCMTCYKPIKLARKADDSGWQKYEVDGVTLHTHPSSKKSSSTNINLELLVMQIRDELRANFDNLNARLDRLQQQLIPT